MWDNEAVPSSTTEECIFTLCNKSCEQQKELRQGHVCDSSRLSSWACNRSCQISAETCVQTATRWSGAFPGKKLSRDASGIMEFRCSKLTVGSEVAAGHEKFPRANNPAQGHCQVRGCALTTTKSCLGCSLKSLWPVSFCATTVFCILWWSNQSEVPSGQSYKDWCLNWIEFVTESTLMRILLILAALSHIYYFLPSVRLLSSS